MLRGIRHIFICAVLALNSLHGVYMRPEEVQALMEAMNQPKVAHVLPDDNYNGYADRRIGTKRISIR